MHIFLLNTSIIPATAPETFVVRGCAITVERARTLLDAADSVRSHVGHDSTAAIMTELLGRPVAMDRTPWDGSGTALVLQLRDRPPEGRILTREEIEAIGYTLRVMEIEDAGQ